MASAHYFIFTLIAISSVFVVPALAKDIVVGDGLSILITNPGLVGKNFMLATSLQGYHNVYKVDGTGFKQCSTAASLSAALTSGFDVITLDTPGRKWYICGVGRHCADGKMKLFINVLPLVVSWSPAPAPVYMTPPLAKEFIVGDESGWTLNFDYQSWALGKEFHVGDKLIFKYKQGYHNVYKVDGTGFKQCSSSASLNAALTSGNDVITLATPGRKWYICGIGRHCADGKMKLFINVLPPVVSWSPTPARPPYYSW